MELINTYNRTKAIIIQKHVSIIFLMLLPIFLFQNSLFSQCSDKPMMASDGASIITGSTGGICFFCSVTNANNVINNATSDYATISIPSGLGGYGYIRVQLPQTYPAGTRVGWVVDVNGGLTGLFSGATLVALNNGTVVGTASGSSLFNLLGQEGGLNVNGVFCQPFNQIEIRVGSLVSIFAAYRVFYPYITEDCAFPVPCGTAPSPEICGDFIDNDGDGLADAEDSCLVIDSDGDGVVDGIDTDIANPCIPGQTINYTGYNAHHNTWQAADCDNDGVLNGHELLDNTNPYDASDFNSGNSNGCLLEGIGLSKWYGDADSQNIGDTTNDDEEDDDFISFGNFSNGNVDISGWELYVDENGLGTPVFTFPTATIIAPYEEVTVIADWNPGPALPNNWFDADFPSGEGFFEETSNNVAYAILRNPLTNRYLVIHQQGGAGPVLGTGTKICNLDFSLFIPTEFEGCEMIYWDASINNYREILDCTIPDLPYGINGDIDGDGVLDAGGDIDPTNPCLPVQAATYTGYDAMNVTWQMVDCDGDGIINGQELINGTDPYLSDCIVSPIKPILSKN